VSGFLGLQGVRVPRRLFEDGHAVLREIGEHDVEGIVLWAGRELSGVFNVEVVLRPVQRGYRTENGLLVLVDGKELHRIGVWLFHRQLRLVAQVHSHPADAYHSETDDTIPIVATEGALSLVVPDFARGAPDLATYSCHRLLANGLWTEMIPVNAQSLITITDTNKD
jgi:hypothetical protein